MHERPHPIELVLALAVIALLALAAYTAAQA